MVKAELTIEIEKDNKLILTFNLLKREDWEEGEWQFANVVQDIWLNTIQTMKKNGVEEIEQKIIKGEINEMD